MSLTCETLVRRGPGSLRSCLRRPYRVRTGHARHMSAEDEAGRLWAIVEVYG